MGNLLVYISSKPSNAAWRWYPATPTTHVTFSAPYLTLAFRFYKVGLDKKKNGRKHSPIHLPKRIFSTSPLPHCLQRRCSFKAPCWSSQHNHSSKVLLLSSREVSWRMINDFTSFVSFSTSSKISIPFKHYCKSFVQSLLGLHSILEGEAKV